MINNTLFGEENIKHTKECVLCNEIKAIEEFPKHISHYDGYDSRCRSCIKKRSAIVRRIKKNAPPKPKVCDCCGKEPIETEGRRKVGLSCDHDAVTDTFRGWLCNHCNVAIGLLGDNTEGMQKALDYLKKHKKNLISPFY